MPYRKLLPLALLLALLCGCAGRSHDNRGEFLSIRGEWLSMQQVELHAAIRADYGDRVYDFVLRYDGTADRGVITVEEPSVISGVSVELGEKGVTLRYDGAELDTGAILGEVNPVQAFPLLLRCWQSAPVTQCWWETREGTRCLVAEFDLTEAGETETRLCRTWFDGETRQPFAAELLAEGRTVLVVRFQSPEGNS